MNLIIIAILMIKDTHFSSFVLFPFKPVVDKCSLKQGLKLANNYSYETYITILKRNFLHS